MGVFIFRRICRLAIVVLFFFISFINSLWKKCICCNLCLITPIWINRVPDPSYDVVSGDFSLGSCDRWVTEGTPFIGNAPILQSRFLIFSPLRFAAALIDSRTVLEFVILCVFWGWKFSLIRLVTVHYWLWRNLWPSNFNLNKGGWKWLGALHVLSN